MSDDDWRDCHLSDIVEAQLVLFCHLSRALDETGLLPRQASVRALREIAAQDRLRPGVRSCLGAIAGMLETAEAKGARPGWTPEVVSGGGANGEVPENGPPKRWRPTIVAGVAGDDDDPDGA